jgi:hypothetical protein
MCVPLKRKISWGQKYNAPPLFVAGNKRLNEYTVYKKLPLENRDVIGKRILKTQDCVKL